MPQGHSAAFVWLLVGVLGLGTFGLRLSFIQLHAWMDGFPPRIEAALAFVPAAILAALVFPQLFSIEGSIASGLLNVRVLAGGVATLVSLRTGSMTLTIVVGMAILWFGGFVVG